MFPGAFHWGALKTHFYTFLETGVKNTFLSIPRNTFWHKLKKPQSVKIREGSVKDTVKEANLAANCPLSCFQASYIYIYKYYI